MVDEKYFRYIIDFVRRKYALALKEFGSTDLNTHSNFNDTKEWFEKLESMITHKLPLNYVKCLNVYEDDVGNIVHVEYEYCCNRDDINDEPTIRIYNVL